MKKTIIAIAAATSVALTQGVAVAQTEGQDTTVTQEETKTEGSAQLDNLSSSEETEGGVFGSLDTKKDGAEGGASSSEGKDLGREIFGWKDGSQQAVDKDGRPVEKDGQPVAETPTTLLKKITDVGLLIGGIVTALGTISALFANIEKIVKQLSSDKK